MRKVKRLLMPMLACSLLCLLCGCSNLSLGERAIVKAIYLDGVPGKYTASLVVFTCEPTTERGGENLFRHGRRDWRSIRGSGTGTGEGTLLCTE